MDMAEWEIVERYKGAKYPKQQIAILADLNDVTVPEIVEVLERKGAMPKKEKTIPETVYNALLHQMDELDQEIQAIEMELNNLREKRTQKEKQYKEIANFIGV